MSVKVRDIELGKGKVKICVPIMGKDLSSLKKEIETLDGLYYDLVEWRVDFYEDLNEVIADGETVRKLLGNTPILATLRTSKEGGNKEVSKEDYASFYASLIDTKNVDLIDVEAFMNEETAHRVITYAHANDVKVILSNHDFHATPEKEEIVRRLRYMDSLQGDICKIACMPNSAEDVLTLLSATHTASEMIERPLITMAMGKLGVVSRLSGETFGSCLSFGCAEKASAPGQINANDLHRIIDLLHQD